MPIISYLPVDITASTAFPSFTYTGESTTTSEGNVVLLTSGTLTFSSTITKTVALQGGGGGSGAYNSSTSTNGSQGSPGIITRGTLEGATFTVVIGSGGIGKINGAGTPGSQTTIGSLKAPGGAVGAYGMGKTVVQNELYSNRGHGGSGGTTSDTTTTQSTQYYNNYQYTRYAYKSPTSDSQNMASYASGATLPLSDLTKYPCTNVTGVYYYKLDNGYYYQTDYVGTRTVSTTAYIGRAGIAGCVVIYLG